MKPRDLQPGPIDFLLSAASVACAVYAAGMGVYKPSIALFSLAAVLVGTLFSLTLASTSPGVRQSGGFLYVCAVAGAVVLTPALNRMLPDGGFPEMLAVTAALIWMGILGSLFAWSESALLFQAVPSVALFGMVGAWDTFPGARWLFYLYIGLTGALLARAHRRGMLRMAQESGARRERLQAGPWRGQAGPLWFAAMAASVVLTSLIGAPVIQQTVEPVTRGLAVTLPRNATPTLSSSPAASSGPRSDMVETSVGNGPVFLSKAEVMRVDLPEPMYLRSFAYELFDGKKWTKAGVSGYPVGGWGRMDPFGRVARHRNPDLGPGATKLEELAYRFRVTGMVRGAFPVPGSLVELQPLLARGQRWRASDLSPGSLTFRAKALVPDPKFQPSDAPRFLPEDVFVGVYGSQSETSERVREFARRATRGAETDYEKAKRLEEAIGRQAVYNTDAPAAPSNRDAVDWFLFEAKEGYCDLYATSMVVAARSLGLPARYAVGFYPANGERDESGWQVIRENEAHAWAEIYFDGVGWVPFDPTQYASVKNRDTSEDRNGQPWWRSERGRSILVGGLALLGCLGLVGGLVLRPRPKAASPPLDRDLVKAVALYDAALAPAAGVLRKPEETVAEYLGRAMPNLGEAADEAAALAATLESLAYAPPSESLAESAREAAARATALGRNVRRIVRERAAKAAGPDRSNLQA
ncbi:MAG: DUF3488 and transglutaminase-like domain-containing protein [Fimbriimonadales bacterium]|nr:DUF3488 and transglutaminase-like domain-containing protein [Fimbriimonadales bacterium]